MNIDGQAKFLANHCRAFDVPTRPSWAPGRIPARLPGFAPFPKSEIKGVFLATLLPISRTAAGTLLLLIGIATTELAVVLGFGNIEIHITIGAVGSAFGFQLSNERLDAVDATGGSRHAIGWKNIQPAHVDLKGFDVALADRLHRAALFGSAIEDLVVDIGVILDVGDVVAAPN